MKDKRSSALRISLQPFTENQRNGLEVECLLDRSNGRLSLEYTIKGEVEEIVIPERHKLAHRRDELWSTTCFESFFKTRDSPGYWEVNVSPDGCWNLYRFRDYRRDMTEEPSVSAIASGLTLKKDMISLSVSLPVNDFVPADKEMLTGVSCVLEFRGGDKNYWAITHPGDQPDFHHPESIVLSIREN